MYYSPEPEGVRDELITMWVDALQKELGDKIRHNNEKRSYDIFYDVITVKQKEHIKFRICYEDRSFKFEFYESCSYDRKDQYSKSGKTRTPVAKIASRTEVQQSNLKRVIGKIKKIEREIQHWVEVSQIHIEQKKNKMALIYQAFGSELLKLERPYKKRGQYRPTQVTTRNGFVFTVEVQDGAIRVSKVERSMSYDEKGRLEDLKDLFYMTFPEKERNV